ncbi:MAG: hypothetical protein DSY91_01435 [Deltaproteobacteria bacterium]|nr:MAG: hypothetical protein DSY91_01435 [Deltaproteobacteria bacterium]
MKRLHIHWSARWFIRLCYVVLILAIVSYVGLGLFLKSSLAGDLLIKQLSRQAGRPVHVGSVNLDWFRGFSVVLKDVEVPSLTGGPPVIFCKSMVTTVEIWPFITRSEIVFRHISLEDGSLRLRRNKQGKWRGVFPVPVAPVSKTQEIKKPGKAKRKFVLFFPKVSLKRIFIEIVLESKEGTKRFRMFLKKAKTFGTRKQEKIRGEAEGTIQLLESPHKIAFHVKGVYALISPFPFDVSVNISNLSLEELDGFFKEKPRWHLEGVSRLTLLSRGKFGESFTFQGNVFVEKPRFTSRDYDIRVPGEESSFSFDGKGRGIVKGSPEISLHVSIPEQPFHVRVLREGRPVYSQRGVFRDGILKGTATLFPRHLGISLACNYHLGRDDNSAPPGKIEVKGDWSVGEKSRFKVGFSTTKIPLEVIASGRRVEGAACPVLKSEPPPSIKAPPLRLVDRLEGKVEGEVTGRNIAVEAARLAVSWRKSRVAVAVSPFRLPDTAPIVCSVTAKRIEPAVVQASPAVFGCLPPKVKEWSRAFQKGEISSFSGQFNLERSSEGKLKKVSVESAQLRLSSLSLIIPPWGLPVEDLSGAISFQTPSLNVSGLKCLLPGNSRLNVKKLKIKNVFKGPIRLETEAEFSSDGIQLLEDDIPPQIQEKLTFPLSKAFSFSPEFFSGSLGIRFNGSLFPFSAKDFNLVLRDVLLKGALAVKGQTNAIPLTFTATATIAPDDFEATQVSLKTPLGWIISSGTATRSSSGEWELNVANHGEVSLEGTSLYSFLPRTGNLRLTGKASFAIKVEGAWPHLSLQGDMDGKQLYCSYKDIFIKNSNVPAAIDFQIKQTGPQSCEIAWIRGKLRGFVIRLWGNLTSFKPLRGKLNCETSTHQIQQFMPLFPRYCSGNQCLLAKGDIQCQGQMDLKEVPEYEVKAVLVNVSLPFPGGMEPINIAKVKLLLSDHERSIDIMDVLYRESDVPQIKLEGKLREGQWFWNAQFAADYLDLDDFISKIHHQEGKEETRKKDSGEDLFASIIKYLHGKYFQGSVSVQKLKILNYSLFDLFARFEGRGNSGNIKGFNFLTQDRGYGAIDISWMETDMGKIILKLSPLVKDLDFGKILDGLLHRSSPFRGWLTFGGQLTAHGGTYQELRDGLNGHLDVTFKEGVITHWAVFTSIFQLLDLYDIIAMKNLPGISTKGLEYELIHGTVQVNQGVAKTDDAYLKSRPFFMSGKGTLILKNHQVSLLIGIYPFKVLDSVMSHIPIIGRIITNRDKKFIGYFFKAEGDVTNPEVTSVNIEKFGERVWDTFKKIITLPLYPFQDHSKKEGER